MIDDKSLLLIDDEQSVLQTLKLWLAEKGYTIYTARSRQEAVQIMEEHTVALCLIDLRLGDEDGLQISNELKKRDAFLKIIIITGYPSYDTAIDAMKMGVFDYVSKSADLEEILDKIESAVNARRDEIAAKTGTLDTAKKIILVCHHVMIKEGFENFCREESGYTLVHTYHSCDYIKHTDFNNEAVLVLLCTTCHQSHLEQPEEMFSRLQVFFPNAKVVMINSQFSDQEKMELITRGAKGFLSKNIARENMKKAFNAIMRGEMWVSRKVTDSLLDRLLRESRNKKYEKPESSYQLSRREVEILQAVASGLSNLEISEKLFISEKTVKAHINHIFKKMGVKSRTQAVMRAVAAHIV